ncbi:zinc-binding dehydrogenase [uncultured Phenylobacterium sp.]|uniref:zinc-binding dehydrogenase n=1 Tax=uncultured Phenylobacterium sp. TaxID=349273 RepID=UPI0025CFFBBC|nr:zinc-binding dehydrogenase [uncultured Phenylobacterium sp.]
MRAVVITEKGPALREIAQPEAKPGQVLVKVHANALNRADLAMAAGHLHGTRGGVGAVMGLEWAGEIAALGAGVNGLSLGDRVMGSGGFADYVAVPAGQVLRIPDANLSFEEAACFPVALRTMHNAIVTAGAFQAGETVLIQGASSGVGILGMQIAREMGAAKVIGSSTNPQRRARLAEFGADLAIDTSDPDWVQAVLDATGGRGVDLIVDQVSGGLVTPNMRAARVLGRIVNVGRLGGTKTHFDADLHALRRITYVGVTFRTRTAEEVAEITRALLADLTPALEARRFSMPIDSVFPLEGFAEALAKMKANEHFGKIVLRH